MNQFAILTQTGVPTGGNVIAQNAKGGSALGAFTKVLKGFLGGQTAGAMGPAAAGGFLPAQFLKGQDGEAGLVEILPGVFVPANPQATLATVNATLALGAAPGQNATTPGATPGATTPGATTPGATPGQNSANAAQGAQGVAAAIGGLPSVAADAAQANSPLGAVPAKGVQPAGVAANAAAPRSIPTGTTTADAMTPLAASKTEILPATPTLTSTGPTGPTEVLADVAAVGSAPTVTPVVAEAAIRSAAQNIDVEGKTQVAADPAGDGENAKGPRQPQLAQAAMTAANHANARAGAASAQPKTGEPEPVQTTNGIAAADPMTSNDPAPIKTASPVRSATPADVSDQIAVRIHKAVSEGTDRITIRLHPPSLGRVEVRLEISHDGRLTAILAAEKGDTLELLQRDARGLERALQEAGLKTDSGSLSFQLRGDGREQSAFADGSNQTPLSDDGEPGEGAQGDASQHQAHADLVRSGLLDIHV